MSPTPEDSRYVPLTQQPYCCVPTCFQMIMYKFGIPLVPAEAIGYYLGLVVPPEDEHYFYNVRVSAEVPLAGYGTKIYLPQYEPNAAFKRLGIPLQVMFKLVPEFNTAADLAEYLQTVETSDGNALLCFNQGALVDDPKRNWGHVVVFDRIIDGQLRIIDPSPTHPKWRTASAETMYDAMKQHGEERSGGVWMVEKI